MMKGLRAAFGRGIWPAAVFLLLSMIVFSASRLGLCLWKGFSPSEELMPVFVQGLRSDFSIACTSYALPFVLLVIMQIAGRAPAPLRAFVRLLLCLAVTVHVFMEIATPPFIAEYGVRPNRLFLDYLVYPKEVISTLAQGHLGAVAATLIASIACFAAAWKWPGSLLDGSYQTGGRARGIFAFVVLAAVLPLGIRSTLGHRPLNPSMLAFSGEPLLDSLPVNSSFNVFYAARHYGDYQLSEGQIYAFDSEDHVKETAILMSARNEPFARDDKCPINQSLEPSQAPRRPLNVVIVLEESMGADFVKSLGGLPLTPELEKLKGQGWWFSNMIAAGHRSVRGIEAVTAGFPPSPLSSQVRLDHAAPIATLMEVYRQLGYDTSFIYGGESHFDNMRTYFMYNGTQSVTEQKDYRNPSFTASWGVSDEDLFARADENFTKLEKEGKPFMSVVFTSSFHDPFDIPQGKVSIDGIQTTEPARMAAVKYADYALGRFFEKARQGNYYKDTVFLVIADHESRVESDGPFPLQKFLIPAVIIGPNVPVRDDPRMTSQIDMAPTLLSLTGVAGDMPFAGQDMTRGDAIERAPIIFHDTFGYLVPGKLVTLDPNRTSHTFKVTGGNRYETTPAADDKEMVTFAMGVENLGPMIYEKRWNDAACIKGLRQERSSGQQAAGK
jgi:phosphoglycerol transferase MdoB-like AlkP superfamily enzyme